MPGSHERGPTRVLNSAHMQASLRQRQSVCSPWPSSRTLTPLVLVTDSAGHSLKADPILSADPQVCPHIQGPTDLLQGQIPSNSPFLLPTRALSPRLLASHLRSFLFLFQSIVMTYTLHPASFGNLFFLILKSISSLSKSRLL